MANPWDNDPVVQPQRGIVRLPRSPEQIAAEQRAQAAEARAAEDQAIQRRRLENEIANANKPPAGYRWNAQGALEPVPGGPADPATLQAATRPSLTAKERADAIGGYTSAGALDRIIKQLEDQFKVGPGATSGISGLRDYLPTEDNRQFDNTANAARGIVGTALGFTGGQLNTQVEAEKAVGPYLPQSDDRDQVILDKIERLRQLSNDARIRSEAILGGVPDANGRITPNAMEQTGVTAPALRAAGAGATSQMTPLPPEMQQEYAAYLMQNTGRLDPDAYAQFRLGLAAKYGMQEDPARAGIYRDEANTLNQYAAQGGKTFGAIPGAEKPLSGLDAARNALVSNPVGAAAAGFGDAGGFGIPSALLPQQMEALGNKYPIGMAVGQVGGAIGATNGLAAVGRAAARKLAPAMMGGGKLASFGRNVATDAAYGGIYGGTTQGDPLTGATLGAAGSTLGQGIGSGLGKVVGGVSASPIAQQLTARGIPLTVGQNLGGMVKRAEDAMTSIPFVGDIIGNRRLEGLRAFNQAAIGDAGAPIGAQTNGVGENAVGGLMDQISNSYDRATAGVNVRLDPTFSADLQAALQAGSRLPGDYATKFNAAMANRVNPIVDAGEMTGAQYQQATRGLKSYRAEMTKPGFEQDYRDALTIGMDALTGQMMRGGGQGVVDGLTNANKSYSMAKVLQKAVQAAKNGTGSGEVQVFTPAQLNTSATQAANKFGGQRPFAELIDAGQTVLPSQIPDSGTGRRIAQMALPAALGGAGAGIGAAGGDAQGGAVSGLGVGALLALGGTRRGQKVLNNILTSRPELLNRLGQAMTKHRGMFGSAAIPFVLEANK